jgi:hypothetical protein
LRSVTAAGLGKRNQASLESDACPGLRSGTRAGGSSRSAGTRPEHRGRGTDAERAAARRLRLVGNVTVTGSDRARDHDDDPRAHEPLRGHDSGTADLDAVEPSNCYRIGRDNTDCDDTEGDDTACDDTCCDDTDCDDTSCDDTGCNATCCAVADGDSVDLRCRPCLGAAHDAGLASRLCLDPAFARADREAAA